MGKRIIKNAAIIKSIWVKLLKKKPLLFSSPAIANYGNFNDLFCDTIKFL